MKYVIVDERGIDCGGTICKEWNSLQDYKESVMNCRSGYYAGHIRVFLLFMESELLDDIQLAASVQGKTAQKLAREQGKPVSEFGMFQEIGESDYWKWSKRVIGVAMSEAESVLYSIAKHRTTGPRSKDDQREKQVEYALELRVPNTFSDTSMMAILRYVHDFIVARVLWEWANLTYVPFAEFWLSKMDLDKQNMVKEALRGSTGEARLAEGWV